ncbi:MAG TPA: right-handed parallel beta-helix repeat-containing protein [Solirubrobacteraceae bacterium]|nr:right-handed parallel beta-helix repeat-containing protein [Solirubrobacteraceae bacterium]
MPRSSLLVVAVSCLLAVLALVAPAAGAASRPAVAPKGSCTEMRGDKLVAVFDVSVAGSRAAKVRKGKRNRVSGGRVIGKLPTVFHPGATPRALRVAFARRSKQAKWRLDRRTAAVRRGAKRCASAKPAPKSPSCCPTTSRGATPGVRPPSPTTSGYCASAQVTGAWGGNGRTLAATPATLSSVVARASAGDTIELADGVYNGASVTLTKAVRLRAAHQFGAVFVGGPTPRYANDTGLGGHAGTAVSVRASGATVEGLELRYYNVGIDLDSVANVTVQGNRVVSMYDAGIQVWDTRSAEIRCNEVLDPYLAQDVPATVTSGPGISEAQSDYGVAVYGSLQPRIEHNYFHGVFNQTLSFKEGNRDAYAGYNTFEGSALTALFFGQNIPHNGPYSFTGLPVDEDRGTIVAEYNVFREVYGIRDGAKVVYYMRSPIRVWHVDGNTTVRGNVIEQAQQGVLLECRSGSQAGCNAGTTRLTGNTIGGRVRDLGGTIRQVNVTAGALVYTGLQAQATLDGNVFAQLGNIVGSYSDGVSGTPSIAYTGNRELSTAGVASLDLRPATPSTDPDLSFAAAYR